jgi:hypothetical protein
MRRKSAGRIGVSVADTPTIIIGLPGPSMRSQAVSMLDIRWWLGVFMLRSPLEGHVDLRRPGP